MNASPSPGTITQKQPSAACAFWVEALDKLIGASQAVGNREESNASDVVRAYLYKAPLPPKAKTLSSWDGKKTVWSALLPSSYYHIRQPVYKVRVFSVTGNVLNPNWAQLASHLIEQIMVIKFNLPKLGYSTLNLDS